MHLTDKCPYRYFFPFCQTAPAAQEPSRSRREADYSAVTDAIAAAAARAERAHVMSVGGVWRNNLRSLLRRLETPDVTQLDDDVTQMSTQQQPEPTLDASCDSIKPHDVISHVTHEPPFVSTKAGLKHDRLLQLQKMSNRLMVRCGPLEVSHLPKLFNMFRPCFSSCRKVRVLRPAGQPLQVLQTIRIRKCESIQTK